MRLFRSRVWNYYHYRHRYRIRKILSKYQKPMAVKHAGAAFELHTTLNGLSENLAIYGFHEPMGTKAYLENLTSGGHIIDIGSNLGYFLLLAAREVGESGRVIGFEPVANNFSILQRNIDNSGRTNVKVFPWAIANKNAEMDFYESEVPNWGSLIQNERLRQVRTVPLMVRSLDAMLKEDPSIKPSALRMDLDGGELIVLEGAWNTLRTYLPTIFIEFHPFALGWDSIRNYLSLLEDIGYSSGVLIDRIWDHPWTGKWMRERRRWVGSLNSLINRIEADPKGMKKSVFSMVLKSK